MVRRLENSVEAPGRTTQYHHRVVIPFLDTHPRGLQAGSRRGIGAPGPQRHALCRHEVEATAASIHRAGRAVASGRKGRRMPTTAWTLRTLC